MNKQFPLFTLLTQCQDCYKCLRLCPVKAISFDQGHASIISDRCVACGRCYQVCPFQAKYVRNDRYRAIDLLTPHSTVIVSLAPSYKSVFHHLTLAQMIAGLKKLGFTHVSETALGAQEVSNSCAQYIAEQGPGIYLSSACPTMVDYVRLYLPQYSKFLTPFASPAVAHGKMLKEIYGENCKVVFIGPCIAKKNEADNSPFLDVALTFRELTQWWDDAGIDPSTFPATDPNHQVVPEQAGNGSIYPIEGGMIESIKKIKGTVPIRSYSVVGINYLQATLERINPAEIKDAIFVETLACHGGCINGPDVVNRQPVLLANEMIWQKTQLQEQSPQRPPIQVVVNYSPRPLAIVADDTGTKLTEALASVGKTRQQDELNCGGCGYDSCRHFAQALVEKRAEVSMCLSYMRKLAHSKSNGLMRAMPAGIVMVDHQGKILEANEVFWQMFPPKQGQGNDQEDKIITELFPCAELITMALKKQKDITKDYLIWNDRLWNVTIFSIEAGKTLGLLINDITQKERKKEFIVKKAQEIINKNMRSVQEIACLLGEHMADTESLLNSIMDSDEVDKR